jgi:hypothetical protein
MSFPSFTSSKFTTLQARLFAEHRLGSDFTLSCFFFYRIIIITTLSITVETQFIVSHKSLGFILSLPPGGRSQDGQRPHPETQVATQQHVKHMVEEINGRSLRRLRHRLEQGWANFFVGGPNEKSKMSGGPT